MNKLSESMAPTPGLWAALFFLGAVKQLTSLFVDLREAVGIHVPFAATWIGRDFTNLWVGSKLAREGVNIYNNADYVAGLSGFGIQQWQNYSYPPATLLVGTPLSFLPYQMALALWVAGGLIAFFFAAKPYIRFHPAWLLLLPGLLTRNGQWGVFAAALFLWSFRGSGFAAGLLTLKPHLGLVLAATMAFKQRWRQILVAVIICSALWGAAEVAFGLTNEFFTDGVRVQRLVLTYPGNQPYFDGMPSAYIRLRGFQFAWLAHSIVAGLALAIFWRIRHHPMKALAFPAATTTFLVLPYGFLYDMAVVSLGFAILMHQRWTLLNFWKKTIVALCFLSPAMTGVTAIPLILLVGLYIQSIELPGLIPDRSSPDEPADVLETYLGNRRDNADDLSEVT